MKQKIIKYTDDKILSIIEDIIKKIHKVNINIFYPETKSFFQNYIDIFKEIYNKEPNIIDTLVYYKTSGYRVINNILFYNKFPLIYIFDWVFNS